MVVLYKFYRTHSILSYWPNRQWSMVPIFEILMSHWRSLLRYTGLFNLITQFFLSIMLKQNLLALIHIILFISKIFYLLQGIWYMKLITAIWWSVQLCSPGLQLHCKWHWHHNSYFLFSFFLFLHKHSQLNAS